ncbi:MAG: hypothetical protein QE486_00355 [Burkholderiaceae bacterium]|nr:hypothetical protein [Burkholderiaceae bacterium]
MKPRALRRVYESLAQFPGCLEPQTIAVLQEAARAEASNYFL